MTTANNAAEQALIKIRDYKENSPAFLKNGYLTYPEYQQFIQAVLTDYFTEMGGMLPISPVARPPSAQ